MYQEKSATFSRFFDQNPIPIEVSIILPCRNEEKAVGFCVRQIRHILKTADIYGEIILSDSSKDLSPYIAYEEGAIIVKHGRFGYGAACLEGFRKAKGKYIFFVDCDGSYDFSEIPRFLQHLKEGHDLIVGNRFQGRIKKGAMSWLRRYFGNPILSAFVVLFFKPNVSDVHCGLRAVKRTALESLHLKTQGMEFASEMIIKAALKNLRMKELPINYFPRIGKSKLRTFRDGFRHLHLILNSFLVEKR